MDNEVRTENIPEELINIHNLTNLYSLRNKSQKEELCSLNKTLTAA